MLAVLLVQITLIDVTGPGGQLIELNPSAIVTMRPPRRSDGFSPGSLHHHDGGREIHPRSRRMPRRAQAAERGAQESLMR